MSNITLDELVPLLTREATSRAGTLLAIFCLVSVVFLVAGFFWQKKYTSAVQLYVDDSNIVAPIIGTEQVTSRDKANVAKEELFAVDIIDRILEEVGFVDASTSAAERLGTILPTTRRYPTETTSCWKSNITMMIQPRLSRLLACMPICFCKRQWILPLRRQRTPSSSSSIR